MKKKFKNLLLIALSVALASLFLYVSGIGCPLKYVTGISCPGCGMTRAWFAALTLHFQQAFAYHPLFFLVPVVGLLYLFEDKIGRKLFNAVIIVIIIAFIVVYGIRMCNPNDQIVQIDVSKSVIGRILQFFR